MGLRMNQATMQYGFAGIHFRFSPGDFFSHEFLTKPENQTAGNHMPVSISKHIHRSLKQSGYFKSLVVSYMKPRTVLSPLKTIFVTSPISIAENLRSNDTYLSEYKVFTSLDTEEFLRNSSEDCDVIQRFFGDVLSTLEKDILSWGKVFFRTRPSNWSFNLQGRRMARYKWELIKEDRPIYGLFPKHEYVL